MKTCTSCARELPATTEHFHRHPTSPDGLKPRCKQCRRTEEAARYQARPDKETVIARAAAWAKANPERVRVIHLENYRRARLKPRRRIVKAFGNLLGMDLAARGHRLERDVWAVLPYTVGELMAHLEARFQPGMSWPNHGRWHIDHVRPRSAFSYRSPTDRDFADCWALSNLQPLWAEENLRKGAKWAC